MGCSGNSHLRMGTMEIEGNVPLRAKIRFPAYRVIVGCSKIIPPILAAHWKIDLSI